MCDFGRLTFEDLTSINRILSASVEGARASLADAAAAAGTALKPRKLGVVFGAKASNEANHALAALVQKHLPGSRIFLVEGNDPGSIVPVDKVLLDADKTPNRAGALLAAQQCGTVEGGVELARALMAREIDALLVLQDNVLGRLGLDSATDFLVYIGTWRNATARAARVVLPSAAAPEQAATWINRKGRVQLGKRAIGAAGDAKAGWELLDAIAVALGSSVVPEKAADVFAAFAAKVPALTGMTHAGLGGEGQVQQAEPEPEPAAPVAAPAK
jgi:NADH dehydrogenase/NADH:ubiquinone oxidoreductase subunit G